MAETSSRESAYKGRLFELYTRYVAEPESKKDVYGYTLLAVGYVLAIGGMLVYFVGPTGADVSADTLFAVRQVAVVPAATGLVLSLMGIVLLMPVTRNSLIVAVLGTVVGLVAVGLFVRFYPYNWHQGTPSYSDVIIGLYTAGVGLVAGVVLMVPVITGERSYFSETTGGHKYDHPEIMIGETERGGLFALFKRGREWTWRFIDQSAVAASTSQFLSRLEAEERVEAVKTQVANAGLLEIKTAAFRLYRAGGERWQWALMREDGSTVAEGGKTYESRDEAETSINAMKDHGPDAELFVMDEPVYDLSRTDGGWRWRLVDPDGTELAVSAQRHTSRESATAGHGRFRELSADAIALVIESYGIELVEDGGWSWRLRDSTHQFLADGTVEYGTKGSAEDAVYELLDRLARAEILERGTQTYDVYQSGSTWRWRLVDGRGKPVASGRDEADGPEPVVDAAKAMRADAAAADVVEITNLEFETYRAADGWGWRLVDDGRRVHARSPETYDTAEDAEAVVDRVRAEAPDADLIEFENAAFQVYEAEGGAWRWRLIDEDGTVMADSGQGEYESKDDAMNAMTTLRENAPEAEHLEIENAAFELFQDDDGWGWRLVDQIGDTIAAGTTRHEAEDGARGAMNSLVETVNDVGNRRMEAGIFQVYADEEDEWWWRFVLPDGRVAADATRSFGTRHEVEDAVAEVKGYAGEAPVVELGRLGVLLDPEDWSWELVDEDRERVAESRTTYEDRPSAVDAIEDLQTGAPETTVYEIRDAAFDCYRGEEGWSWRLVDDEHDTVATAPGSYDELDSVESAIETVGGVAPDAEFLDYDDVAFEIYETDDEWGWRLVDEDRQVIARATTSYASREGAGSDLDAARSEIPEASVIEIDSAVFEFHHTEAGWRWRLVDETGAELAESLSAFPTRAEAQEELTAVKELAPDAWVSSAE